MPTLTPAELTTLRSQIPHTARLTWYLALAPYGDSVFTARYVSEAEDGREITYNLQSGENDVVAGMTLWVGTTAEVYDVGKVRVKSIDVGTNVITVAENNDIDWTLADYLSCPGEAGFRELWGVYPRITVTGDPPVVTFYEDHDLTYNDPVDDVIPPKANAGPPVCAFLNDDGHVDVGFVGDESFTTEVGAALAANCLWDFSDGVVQPPGSVTNYGTCANPNVVRFSSPGFRYVSLTVTDNTAQTRTGTVYVPVWIFDDDEPPLSVQVESQVGNPNWRLIVKAFQTNDTSTDVFYDYPDGALCVLFTVTTYPDGTDDIGGFCHRENIRYVGWLDAESLVFDYDSGTVDFTVISHDLRLKQLPGFGYTLEDNATPGDWYEINDLNLDRALHTHLERRTTTNQICHVERLGEGNTRPISVQPFGDASLYDQAQEHLLKDAMAALMSDRQGVLRVRRNPQFMSVADRNTVEIVGSLTVNDLLGEIDESRPHQYELGYVRLGGFSYETPLLAEAPGIAPAQSEGYTYLEGHIVINQAELNLWAGLWFLNENNPYKAVPVEMIGYWPVFDPAFQEYIRLTATDPLGRNAWSNDRFIVRQVTFRDLMGDGTTRTELILEKETDVLRGDKVTIPPPPPPGPPTPPPPVIITPIDPPEVAVIHDRHKVYSTPDFDALSPTWNDITGLLDGVIFCVEMDQYDRVGAWAVTGTDNKDAEDDAVDVGVWRTNDVTVGAPVWNLVFTQAQGKANRYPLTDCDTFGTTAWGQLRSLVSVAAGECIVGEARWHGLGIELYDATSIFRVDSVGGFTVANHDVGPTLPGDDCTGWCHACGICGSDAPQNASARFHQVGAYMNQDNLRGCHQLYPPYYGLPAVVCGIFSRYHDLFCISAPAPIWKGPWPVDPDATGYQGGARCIIYHRGAWWGYAERNVANTNEGAVYNTLDGEVDDNLSFNFGFCNITSHPDHIWWCKYDPLEARAQDLMLDGVATGINSNDVFGDGGGNGGVIGHIRAIWDADDTVVLVRKEPPAGAQANKTIVWTYDAISGLLDKTGDLGNVWEGTGGILPPGVWNYRYDNVGFTAFGVPLK